MNREWSVLRAQPSRLDHVASFIRFLLLTLLIALVVRATAARAEMKDSSTLRPGASGGADANVNTTTFSPGSLPQEPEQGVRVTRDARGRKMQYVDFSDAVIEGKARTPDGFVIQSRTPGRFNSLVELPRDFRDNILVHSLDAFWGIGVDSK